MAKLERVYNIPLRSGWRKTPRYKKAKKAITTLKEFIARHMKCDIDEVKLGRNLNHEIWSRGIKHPPHHVKVTLTKNDEGIVVAELFGHKYNEPTKVDREAAQKKKEKEQEKKEKAKTVKEEQPKKEDIEQPKAEKQVKEVKEEKKETIEKKVEQKPIEKKPAVKKVVKKTTAKKQHKPKAEKKATVKKATAAKKPTSKKSGKN
jgi:large subunit ribosomal protein L31e